jgi:hypothetical protein
MENRCRWPNVVTPAKARAQGKRLKCLDSRLRGNDEINWCLVPEFVGDLAAVLGEFGHDLLVEPDIHRG